MNPEVLLMYRTFVAILIIAPLLAACGRGEVVQPTTPTVFVPARSATATAQAQREAELAAAEPQQDTTAADVAGDAARGRELFITFQPEANFACNTCHLADSEAQLIGPGLLNIGERAARRVEGQDAPEYLHNAIVNPGAYVVEGYPDNLMPGVYGDIFSEEQINDLIAYLMTL
jgi:cytochrome c2